MLNKNSLDTICASLTYALGVEPPKHAAAPNPDLVAYIDQVFGGEKADRILMYNPDAVAQWVFEKYQDFCPEVRMNMEKEIPLCTVMPSVTPVCFGSMYTGAQPAVHGIQKYEKPVITIDTLFDALLRAGKKPVIVSHSVKSSMSIIFQERNMDYYICERVDEAAAVAAELIIKDEHDVIIFYNGNYDFKMHKFGPESAEALSELRCNARVFDQVNWLVKKHWGKHNTLVGFAMDHGCHEIDGNCGSHGLDMEEDLNILHLYQGYRRTE